MCRGSPRRRRVPRGKTLAAAGGGAAAPARARKERGLRRRTGVGEACTRWGEAIFAPRFGQFRGRMRPDGAGYWHERFRSWLAWRSRSTSGPRCSPVSSPAWAAMSPRDGRRAVPRPPRHSHRSHRALFSLRKSPPRAGFCTGGVAGIVFCDHCRTQWLVFGRRPVRDCGQREQTESVSSALPRPPGASR